MHYFTIQDCNYGRSFFNLLFWGSEFQWKKAKISFSSLTSFHVLAAFQYCQIKSKGSAQTQKDNLLLFLKTNVIIIFQTLSTIALSTVRYVEFVCDCCAGAVIILVSSINEKFNNKYFKNYHVCIQSIDLLMCIFIKLCLIILIIS